MLNASREALALLPPDLSAAAEGKILCAEELRLRTGRKLTALIRASEIQLGERAVTQGDIYRVVEKATGASAHTALSGIASGYISCRAGLRIGLCGTGFGDAGLRDISSLAIRIPHDVRDCGSAVADKIIANYMNNILILSPPGGGKTTFARECVRVLSHNGVRVCVADERGEIAAVSGGEPQFELGESVDVMSNVPKARAAMMMLRSMAPQVIVMDEISSPADAEAVQCASGCGVGVIATAHAASTGDLSARPAYRALSGMFSGAVIIKNRLGERSYSWEAL